jgi:alginate O-acetyltransferase complex protein AlgI
MVFNSLQFILFFVAVYALYRVLPHRAQNWMLLAASYYFYAAWDWRFLSLLLASTAVDYTVALAIARAPDGLRRRLLLTTSIAFNLSLLGFFKYFNFFADNLVFVFDALGWHLSFVTVKVLLPIGISFYTFMTMSYVIDVYRRQFEPTRDLLDFALFVAFFPQLVAGPILRAARLLPQLAAPRVITSAQLRDGLWLILWGYFQKVYVADNLAGLANAVFDPDARVSGVNVLLGVYAFAFQIYGDFAGYSNIARGTSKIMGIELIENFRFPYFVRTAQDFWRHWHISLSTWLRDYLYIPLGGSRGTAVATYRNLFITMLLGGLWHGAAWTFVLWGAYQGLVLVVYRLGARLRVFHRWTTAPGAAARATSWFVMFHVTCYGWLVFRSRSAGQVRHLTGSLFTDFSAASADVAGLLVPLLAFALPLVVIHACEAYYDDTLVVPRLPAVVRYSIYAATFYLTILFGNFGGAEFIYFQF